LRHPHDKKTKCYIGEIVTPLEAEGNIEFIVVKPESGRGSNFVHKVAVSKSWSKESEGIGLEKKVNV
jgi:hypothetical protein